MQQTRHLMLHDHDCVFLPHFIAPLRWYQCQSIAQTNLVWSVRQPQTALTMSNVMLPLANAAQLAAASLRSSTSCEVLLPEDANFDHAIRVWNCDIATTPAIVVHCLTTADVQLAVKAAVSFGLPLSVLGGGYHVHNCSVCAGMVLSLQRMRHVAVDLAAETVTFDGGCTIYDVSNAVSVDSRAIVTGAVGYVGLTGWTLGGGYGQLNGRYGLGVDNVVSAQVVLADGSLVTAGAEGDAELLWCLQGGGGGFGVVVSMTIRHHPVKEVLTGAIMFPIDQAADVLRGYQRLIYKHPDELSCAWFISAGPDGSPVVALSPCWTGDIKEGQQYIQQFEQLGRPIVNKVGRMPWIDMFKPTESGKYLPGFAATGDCRCIGELNDAAIDALVEAARHLPPPHSSVIVHDLHGAATRVAADATAYPLREPHLLIQFVSIEQGSKTSLTARAWVEKLSSALQPHSLPQCWPQLVPQNTEEGRQRIRQTYKDNLPRLMAVKERVDPNNLFVSSVVPLPL